MADHDPAVAADGLALLLEDGIEPRDDLARLGFVAATGHVVVGQCEIKRVPLRDESGGNGAAVLEFLASGRGVNAAVRAPPVQIPAARIIVHRVVLAGRLADPEDGRDDAQLPRVEAACAAFLVRIRGHDHLRLELEDGVLAQLHRIARKICAALVGRLWGFGYRRARYEKNSGEDGENLGGHHVCDNPP